MPHAAERQRPWPAGLPRTLTVPATGLADNLAVSARRYPQRTAIAFYGAEITYAELLRRVQALAAHLAAQGVRAGDRVLVDQQNGPGFVTCAYAVFWLGAVVVPVNPMNMAAELDWIVDDSGARVACVAQDLAPLFLALLTSGRLSHVVVAHDGSDLPPPDRTTLTVPPALRVAPQPPTAPGTAWLPDVQQRPDAAPLHEARGDDLAIIAYTSGTTGQPKGCMLTHRALQAAATSLALWNRWHADAVALSTAPFFHITGLVGSMNLPLMCGATLVPLPRWDRAAAATLIERHGITHWTNVPTMVTDLLALPDLEQRDLSSLVYIGGGGTAMPEAVAARLHQVIGLEYQEGWGLTEVCGAIHLNPPGAERRQCLGVPTFGVDTRVVDTADASRELPVGEAGELVTACPSLFSGYWRNDGATAAAFVEIDGQRFFRTGDIGRVDEDGYFHLADRLKRMINASGYKVWPAEVEALLYKHPAVQEACVVGVADAHRGETVKAYVVRKTGKSGAEAGEPLDADGLIEWSRRHMSAYKVPRIVEFVDELPKSGTGKVLWRKLHEEVRT